jgi:membrane protease YdiL (CAAX protease family)
LSAAAAAAVSALFFGFMHGYSVILLLPVITIGFVFALMREWRGSLVPVMVGHFMHNATALTLVLVLLSAMKE